MLSRRTSPFLALALITLSLGACNKPAEVPPPAPVAPAATTPAAPSPSEVKPNAAAPQAAPELNVATLDGGQYDLAAHRGKWVVVNFWATWCKPCLKEMPELSALDAMRDHVEVLGLAYEEIDTAAMQAFLKKHPVVYPIAIVDTYDPPKAFDTPRGLPMTYLIGPDGSIVDRFLGPVTAHDIEAAIARAGGPKATGA
ncbi:TlpA family protein disulfide reductase [Lysobacter cavernae]|uniref:TlpA family protein disulfide reductase n=1 Tax=Lysobacter cavernae TaxID=1685901 RepID=A0ABV7RTT9_9GAMM